MEHRPVSMTWFDRLVHLLDRMPLDRLILLRDVVAALVVRRRCDRLFPDIESALHEVTRLREVGHKIIDDHERSC